MAFRVFADFHTLCGLLLIASTAALSSSIESSPEGVHSPSVQSEAPILSLNPLSKPIRRSPQAGSDGICHTYVIQGTDTCASIAQAFDLKEKDIETFNANTFAWKGCDKISQGSFICLSPGEPPMPMAFEGAVCGPQVPGTVRPKNMADIESLNPCPSGKCCNLEQATCADVCAPRMVPSNEGGITHLVEYNTKTVAPLAAATEKALSTATTAKAAEQSKTLSSTEPESTWRVVAYTAPWCSNSGNYYMEGVNQTPDECINFQEGISTEWDGKMWCRYHKEEGANSTWSSCDSVEHATAWMLVNAFCTVYRERDCVDTGKGSHILSSADGVGCTNAKKQIKKKLRTWGSMHCSTLSN